MSDFKPGSLVNDVIAIANKASEAILDVYANEEDFDIQAKADQTPVTKADMAAHQVIKQGLLTLTPDIPLLSEEGANIPYEVRKQWQYYWLVDPLDGTKEFIDRNDEFTVNIALIHQHQPILGVVHVPVTQECYYAAEGIGAFKADAKGNVQAIHTRLWQGEKITVTVSRRHARERLNEVLSAFNEFEIIHKGSSIKTCMIAEGQADLYPRFGPTSEWDIAACQCVLEQAGGQVLDLANNPLRYNTKDSLLNPFFIAIGDTDHDWINYFKHMTTKGETHGK